MARAASAEVRIWSYCSRAMYLSPPDSCTAGHPCGILRLGQIPGQVGLGLIHLRPVSCQVGFGLFHLGQVLGQVGLGLTQGASKGRGSMVKRRSPFLTSCPSRKWTLVSSPPTSDLTDTVE